MQEGDVVSEEGALAADQDPDPVVTAVEAGIEEEVMADIDGIEDTVAIVIDDMVIGVTDITAVLPVVVGLWAQSS